MHVTGWQLLKYIPIRLNAVTVLVAAILGRRICSPAGFLMIGCAGAWAVKCYKSRVRSSLESPGGAAAVPQLSSSL